MSETKTRKERGLKIASEYDGVIVIKSHKTYSVASQSDPHQRYTVKLDPAHGHLATGTCTCYDHKHGHKCKHQYAAAAWQLALNHVPILAHERGMTLQQYEDQLLIDLCADMPDLHSTRLAIVLHATQQLLAEEMREEARRLSLPDTVTLVIRYRTSGARHNPRAFDGGELLIVERDDISMAAVTQDPNVAYTWLLENGYQATSHQWIEGAGYMRRRRSTYTK